MKKQKIKLAVFICVGILLCNVAVKNAQAGASATVSWTPPTTDEGGGAMTGLTGYKVYYRSGTSTWLGMSGTCLLGAGTSVDVPGGSSTSYFFNNNLTPGNTYYFTVAATDGINTSACGKTAGNATEVSKRVSYSADINGDFIVDYQDYGTFHQYYGTSNSSADFNKDGSANYLDYGILHADYGKPQL